MPIREREVEAHLVVAVQARGGMALKLTGGGGMPDRLVVLPGGVMRLVEVKTVGGRLSRLQEVLHRRLARLGVQVEVVWTKGEVDALLERIDL